jgi:hypothetical protein
MRSRQGKLRPKLLFAPTVEKLPNRRENLQADLEMHDIAARNADTKVGQNLNQLNAPRDVFITPATDTLNPEVEIFPNINM